MTSIAILGATGQIAKSLAYYFLKDEKVKLYLFSRSWNKVDSNKLNIWDNNLSCNKVVNFEEYNSFNDFEYDLIINCVGVAKPQDILEGEANVFLVTEEYDNLVINYLLKKSNCTKYIYFSSGAVYGDIFLDEVGEQSNFSMPINKIHKSKFYSISKINSEAKHRSLERFNIIDLRVFSFFSRFINLEYNYLLTDIINCIKGNTFFITNKENIIRDYVNPSDLVQLIYKIIEQSEINDAFDVYSLKPVSKFEILDIYRKNFGLKIQFQEGYGFVSPTGSKGKYYPTYYKAGKIGYMPQYTSIDTLISETEFLLDKHHF